MVSYLVGLLVLGLDIWAILNVIKSNADNTMKIGWAVLILVLPIAGLIIWAIAGPRGNLKL
ncbi:MAG TPA: PLD nuclease N-terminal domain-containing protein [Pseudomonas sp.]|nr:PLD nuclease N-terminal domain-containing protein [Pseudomonas sp.]